MERNENTSFLIVDSQSVKGTYLAKESGYDAGKKVKGIKRHIAVDTQGFPHAWAITTADIEDRAGCLLALGHCQDNLRGVQKILADGGYTGEYFADCVWEILPRVEVEVVQRHQLHQFAVIPKRWIVERSFAWLEGSRRLWKNCERTINSSLHMVILSFLALVLKRS